MAERISPSMIRRYGNVATARRNDPRRILPEYLRHLSVDALEAMLGARRRVHIALAEPAPQQLAGLGIVDIYDERTDDLRLEVVRTVAVGSPVAVTVAVAPTGPPVAVILRLEAPTRRDIDVWVYIITSQASRLELCSDRRVRILLDDRAVVRRRPRRLHVLRRGLFDRESAQLRKVLVADSVVGDLLRESWSGRQQRHGRAVGDNASQCCHETLPGSQRSNSRSPTPRTGQETHRRTSRRNDANVP